MKHNICDVCYHEIEIVDDMGPYCSAFCANTSPEEKRKWKELTKDDWGLYPCVNCGCVIDDIFYEDRVCAPCSPKVKAKKIEELLKRAVDYVSKPELASEIREALGQEPSLSSRKERFGLMSTIHSDLILAEERYLESCGWKRVNPKPKEILSLWKTPEFELTYSRNHAVQVSKARDQNLGYW